MYREGETNLYFNGNNNHNSFKCFFTEALTRRTFAEVRLGNVIFGGVSEHLFQY